MVNRISNYIKSYKIFNNMRKNLWLKTRELETLQWEKFKTLLNHAYENVPFYHGLFDSARIRPKDIKSYDDICKIPIINKSDIIDNKQHFIARNINLRNCVEYKTSGSTGKNLYGYLTKDDVIHHRVSYERIRNEFGFRMLRDKLLVVDSPSLISGKKEWYQYLGIRRFERLNVLKPFEEQIEIVKRIKPDVIYGYPSVIKLYAKAVQEKNIKGIHPKLIFTASEVFDSKTRNLINAVFGVELFDVYGAYEAGCMAWECERHSGYHAVMDTVLMEFLDEHGNKVKGGDRGRLVVTNLYSFAMPIIRYEIGDFAIPTYEECPCGRGGYLIKNIEGRYNDMVKLSGNKLIPPQVFYTTIMNVTGISEFRIVQEKEDEIVVCVVKTDESRDFIIVKEINTKLKRVLGDNISIDTKFVESIPREPSGKLRSVISKV
jgi:phenylacetate-CoA ligase